MKKVTTTLAAALIAASTLAGCAPSTPSAAPTQTAAAPATSAATSAAPAGFTAPGDNDKGGKNNPVKIGVMSPEIEYDYLKQATAAKGIHIEYTNFNDYNQPNPAVVSGELDLNQFQHILFLANYNIESGKPLAALQATAIYPLSMYSNKYKAVADIPQGAKIAIPNDETNQARAISVLASAGLVKVKDGVDLLYASPLDIDTAASKVSVVPVQAEQTPRSLDDPNTAAAIINNTYALDAKLNPSDAIAKDDPAAAGSAPFINIWAGKPEVLNDPVIKEVLALAQTKEWQDGISQQSKNSAVIVDQGFDQLQKTLADVETQLKAHKK